VKTLDILNKIAESVYSTFNHFYSEEGIEVGIEISTNFPFKLKIEDYRIICVICKEKTLSNILNAILNNLCNKEILLIKWTSREIYPINAIEGNKILKFQIEEISHFFSYYRNLYDFMVYFCELLGELFNLNYDERLILKRILIDRLVPQKRKAITFRDIFKEIKEAQFRSQFENEYKYSMTKKLDDLINDKLLEEISISTDYGNKLSSFHELNIGLISNFRLKLLLLNLIFNSLHYRIVSGYRPILFLELPCSIFNFIYRLSNIQVWDQIYSTIRILPNIFLISDNLDELPKEIINLIDILIINNENVLYKLEFFHEKINKYLKISFKENEFLVIKKDGKIFELKCKENDSYIIIE